MERESFIFYKSFYEAIHELKDDIKLEVFTAITEYALYGKVPEDLKPVARGLFILIRPNLDANITRYENGKKGGRKPKKAVASPAPAPAPSVPQQYISNVEEEVAEMKRSTQWKESVCIRYNIDPEKVDLYLSDFALKCNKQHNSMQDARSHFCYWLQEQMQKPTQYKSKPTPANNSNTYEYKGGFGGKDQ